MVADVVELEGACAASLVGVLAVVVEFGCCLLSNAFPFACCCSTWLFSCAACPCHGLVLVWVDGECGDVVEDDVGVAVGCEYSDFVCLFVVVDVFGE